MAFRLLSTAKTMGSLMRRNYMSGKVSDAGKDERLTINNYPNRFVRFRGQLEGYP